MQDRMYIAIDLKSFYASVECVERKLDPLTTNLVVADKSRTEKTICLAVSPSLKTYGIPGRARLFEVVQKVKEINTLRKINAPYHQFTGSSCQDKELKNNPQLSLDFITAPPRMARYMEISAKIYEVYLKYIAPEDIHVYSIDEVFIDVTSYLNTYGMTARQLAGKMILDVLNTTGITATAGIGPNLYLCKVAMDIGAKRIAADKNGVRIAELDEISYRREMWNHRPLTDFWRIGRGYARKLEENGMHTMGDIARCSVGKPMDYYNEDLLYRLFGVNAELLIDHAWGWEPCTMEAIKAYKPQNNSIGSGQVLKCPYGFEQARLAVREMADLLVLELVDKSMVTDQIVLTVGYDIDNLRDPVRRRKYRGEIKRDYYGRKIPKHAHGTASLGKYTSSAKKMIEAFADLFDRIADRDLLVRRISISAEHVRKKSETDGNILYEQMELFADYTAMDKKREKELLEEKREEKIQTAVLEIKKKFGKNALLRGMNLESGATARERNRQIGGHRA